MPYCFKPYLEFDLPMNSFSYAYSRMANPRKKVHVHHSFVPKLRWRCQYNAYSLKNRYSIFKLRKKKKKKNQPKGNSKPTQPKDLRGSFRNMSVCLEALRP